MKKKITNQALQNMKTYRENLDSDHPGHFLPGNMQLDWQFKTSNKKHSLKKIFLILTQGHFYFIAVREKGREGESETLM